MGDDNIFGSLLKALLVARKQGTKTGYKYKVVRRQTPVGNRYTVKGTQRKVGGHK
jgi:hypothetical protein